MKTLHFTGFELFEVVVPCRPDLVEGVTPATWPDLPLLLVRARLSDGGTALTEFDRGTSPEAALAILCQLKGRNLLASPPVAPLGSQAPEAPALYGAFSGRRWEMPGFASLECLTIDAMGRHWGVPAHYFLGGAVRDRVEADFWSNQPTTDTARRLAAEAVRLGVRGWKMKAGLNRRVVEVARMIAEEFGPGFRLTIDPMGSWRSPLASADLWRELRGIDAAIQIEDPFPHAHPELWREAARVEGRPLVWHPRTLESALAGLRDDFASGFNFGQPGSAFTFLAGLAEAAGQPCWQGSSIESGIFQHYRLHSAVAAPACTLGSDLCSEWVRESTLITAPMEYHEGCALVPDRPGLGVELDLEAVNRYCRSYREISIE